MAPSSTLNFVPLVPVPLTQRRIINPPQTQDRRIFLLNSQNSSEADTMLNRLLSIQRSVLKRRNGLRRASSAESNVAAPQNRCEEQDITPISDRGLHKVPQNSNNSSAALMIKPDSPKTLQPVHGTSSTLSPPPTTSISVRAKYNLSLSTAESDPITSSSQVLRSDNSCEIPEFQSFYVADRYEVRLPWKWKKPDIKPSNPAKEQIRNLASFETPPEFVRGDSSLPRASFALPVPTLYVPSEPDNSNSGDSNVVSAEAILENLNEQQRQAVTSDPSKACLVLAGPGSGKTRVLAHRIAYLIHAFKVPPAAIISVTFTNKAAGEMRSRVSKILSQFGSGRDIDDDTLYDRLTVGTFHWVCARLLRKFGSNVGVSNDFQICDMEDSRIVLSRTIKKYLHGAAPEARVVNILSSQISKLKNDKGAELKKRLPGPRYGEIVRWRDLYDADLRAMNMLDFDDLLVETRRLLQESSDVRIQLQERYRHVLVDEWQDTNNVQFDVVALLAGKADNLFVVGDVDQSIYKFRGADSGNIERYLEAYKGANKIVLSMNYRSTVNIINAAKEVIEQNNNRPEKDMLTINVEGEKVKLLGVYSDWEEARFIIKSIEKLLKSSQISSLSQCAIMYRTNAQSRPLEEACLLYNIPYILQSGIRFFERREIKDILAYLKILFNPEDDSALVRVLNVPPRGIGKRTLELIELYANRKKLPLVKAIDEMMGHEDSKNSVMDELNIRATTLKRVKGFHDVICNLRQDSNKIMYASESQQGRVGDVIAAIVHRINYVGHLSSEEQTESRSKSLDRIANIQELARAACRFDDPSAFLQRAALMSGPQSDEDNGNSGAIWLSTLHGSKGLEFDAVYISGLEDGIVPLLRDGTIEDIEEERRLLYVGMTRAKKFLTLTWRRTRNSGKKSNADTAPTKLSRFLIGVSGISRKIDTTVLKSLGHGQKRRL